MTGLAHRREQWRGGWTVSAVGLRQSGEFIEQPMPAAMLEETRWVRSKVHIPIIADEVSLHPADIPKLRDSFDGVNIKLDKCGGILEAYRMIQIARSLGMKNIVAAMKDAGVKRIVALGGLGVLNATNDTYLIDQPGYPEEYKPVGREHLLAYEYLKASNLDWTFVCSPNIENHTASGRYTTNANYPPSPDNGYITAGDLAAFMLQEITSNHYKNKRVGISNAN